jgi:predicted ATPase
MTTNVECRASLYFDNIRYGNISKEHKGSLKWIWTHDQYKEWSKPDASRFLYLQGKPGSGKSTLTRYFKDNLSKWDPNVNSAIVANFFYSDRDGELQKSHFFIAISNLNIGIKRRHLSGAVAVQ